MLIELLLSNQESKQVVWKLFFNFVNIAIPNTGLEGSESTYQLFLGLNSKRM